MRYSFVACVLYSLQFAYVAENQIQDIPSEIGLARSLSVLHLHENALQGSIPSEMGLLSSSLKELTLSNNTLQGSVPSELGELSNLYMLFLSDNPDLSGTLPVEVMANLTALEAIDVSNTSVILPPDGLPQPLKALAQNLTYYQWINECKQIFPCNGPK